MTTKKKQTFTSNCKKKHEVFSVYKITLGLDLTRKRSQMHVFQHLNFILVSGAQACGI